jgi:hypothetical protein
VHLVDHQDGVGEIGLGGEGGERDVGIEGVVVVADRDLHLLLEVEADFERAGLDLARRGEDVVGLERRALGEQPRHELRRLELAK